MVKMLVDTNLWLGLAKDPKDVALISIMERLIADGLLTLIVPSIVLKEFLGNRERVATDYGRRLSAPFRIVRDAIETSGAESRDIEATLRFLDEVDQKRPGRAKFAAQTFNRIEKLLKSVPSIDASQAVKLAVFQRAIDRRAPFHEKKSEAADAVMIEIYSECVQTSAPSDGVRWMFVSRNTEDFGSEKGNAKNPHPDYTCFSPGKSEYFISLPDALRKVQPTVVAELMRIWEQEQPTLGELIDRYIEDDIPAKPLAETRLASLTAMRDRVLCTKIAAKLQKKDIVEYCRSRHELDGVDPKTIRGELIHLRAVLKTAETDWEVLGVSTDVVDQGQMEAEKLELVGNSYELQGRRPTTDEIQGLLDYFRKQDKHPNSKIVMSDLVEFAAATGRGRKEINSLRWADFNERDGTCGLKGKIFPLLPDALAIILRQPRTGTLIFPNNAESVGKRFIDAKIKLNIKGLRFQDLRREAVMRMLAAKLPLDLIEQLTGLGPLSLARYRASFARGDSPQIEKTWKRKRKLRFTPRS